jgi:hypothetical protein
MLVLTFKNNCIRDFLCIRVEKQKPLDHVLKECVEPCYTPAEVRPLDVGCSRNDISYITVCVIIIIIECSEK